MLPYTALDGLAAMRHAYGLDGNGTAFERRRDGRADRRLWPDFTAAISVGRSTAAAWLLAVVAAAGRQ